MSDQSEQSGQSGLSGQSEPSGQSGLSRVPASSGPSSLPAALVGVGLVGVLGVAAASVSGGWVLTSREWFDSGPPNTYTPPAQPPTDPRLPSEAGPLQQWIGVALAVLLGLLLLAAVVWLARWLWRRRPRRAVVVESKPDTTPEGVVSADPDLPTLARGAEEAERILAQIGGVPRDLVLRCWLALEEAAARSGVPRRPSASPTEFTATVLRSTEADHGSIEQLLRLYHRARFSQHPVTDDDVRLARGAVVSLARRWRGFDTAMRHTIETRP
ncbi:MAG: DUF4129 domain-containing protein [Microlunatus sp.]|nr:DUF4129 domain-containing protein [Microlunatus sp.]